VPCENVDEDLPTYQQSALGRFLTARLMARARTRREAAQAGPIRVQATTGRTRTTGHDRQQDRRPPREEHPALPDSPLHLDFGTSEAKPERVQRRSTRNQEPLRRHK